MRQAHSAELEALYKVLRLLGGEVTGSTPTAGATDAAPTATADDKGQVATGGETAPVSEGDSGASTE